MDREGSEVGITVLSGSGVCKVRKLLNPRWPTNDACLFLVLL